MTQERQLTGDGGLPIPPPSLDDVLLDRREGYAIVTLNRPVVLNAINWSILRRLKWALDEAEADDNVKAIILTGAGRAFCSGGDLQSRPPEDGQPNPPAMDIYIKITALGYGAMELRGAPRGREISRDQASSILNAVLDSGINYIDTSIDYGQSEELIGGLIAGRRSEYFLASKCGCLVGEASAPQPGRGIRHVFTRENIVAGVEQSLRRMKTDYLDVVQFHGSPSKEELERNDAVATLQDLKAQGKIRFLGMSGTLPNLTDHVKMGVFDVFQIPYSALQREHEQAISDASKAGAGIVIRGGVARGGPGKEEGNFWDLWQKANVDNLLGDPSTGSGQAMTRMEFVFRFTISHPEMDTTIVGTINPEHLRDNLSALAKGPLPPDIYAEAKRRLSAAGLAPSPA